MTAERPRLRRILRELAENSSIHGLPKIASAKQLHMKLIWIAVFLATTGFLGYQLNKLFENYLSWPIKTSVSLQYNPLPFPAVSFCNMNPIKSSFLNFTSSQVHELLSPSKKKKRKNSTETTGEPDTTTDSYSEDSLISATGTTTEFPDWLSGSGDGEFGGYYYYTDWWDYYNYYNYEDDVDPFDYGGTELYEELEYFYDDLDAPRDRWISRIEAFKEAFKNESRKRREEFGHHIKDMLVSCSFNSRKCFYNNFTLFQSSEYGNCFTLKSDKFFSRKPGPNNGLWLTLNLEVLEYITNFATGYGIKLFIHQPGTVVFPAVEGLVLSPGHETTIALRMVSVERLGQPYGDCTEGKDFEETLGFRYTIPACIQLCKQQWVAKLCGCLPNLDIETENTERITEKSGPKLEKCDVKERLCMLKVDAKYLQGKLDCSCDSPCRELVYEKTISGRPWPNDVFLRQVLVRDMCRTKNLSYTADFCSGYLKDPVSSDLGSVKNNFLRAIIYYEDINYEAISESPLYDSFQFLSNVGGTLGLFLGASVLSFVELVQLAVELLNYFRQRVKNHQISTIHVKEFQESDEKENKVKF